MKKLTILLIALGVLSAPTIVHAESETTSTTMVKKGGKHKEKMEMLRNMSDEERKAYFAEKKAKWDALSEEEKEAKRAEMKAKKAARKAKFEEKYATLSDEEKAEVDAKREKMKKHREKRKEKMKAYRKNWNVNE